MNIFTGAGHSSARNRRTPLRLAVIAMAVFGTSGLTDAEEGLPPAPQPALATPANAPTAATSATRAMPFGDWTYRCVDVKNGAGAVTPSCEVAHVAQVKQDGKDVPILTLAIAKAADDPAGKSKQARPGLSLTALVPLNVLLPSGLTLSVADKPLFKATYRNCNQAGCWVQQKLDASALASLQRAKAGEAEAQLRLISGQDAKIRFSLKGLSAALTELNKPAAPR